MKRQRSGAHIKVKIFSYAKQGTRVVPSSVSDILTEQIVPSGAANHIIHPGLIIILFQLYLLLLLLLLSLILHLWNIMVCSGCF